MLVWAHYNTANPAHIGYGSFSSQRPVIYDPTTLTNLINQESVEVVQPYVEYDPLEAAVDNVLALANDPRNFDNQFTTSVVQPLRDDNRIVSNEFLETSQRLPNIDEVTSTIDASNSLSTSFNSSSSSDNISSTASSPYLNNDSIDYLLKHYLNNRIIISIDILPFVMDIKKKLDAVRAAGSKFRCEICTRLFNGNQGYLVHMRQNNRSLCHSIARLRYYMLFKLQLHFDRHSVFGDSSGDNALNFDEDESHLLQLAINITRKK